jgi:hypothetical protein
MTNFFILSALLLITSCASNKSDPNSMEGEEVKFVEKIENTCITVASVSSMGMSLIPPIASMTAKDMLVKKAKEYRANRLVLSKEEGTFQVELEATAYRCADEVAVKPNPKKAKK